MWESRGGYITNGVQKVKLDEAYRYIVKEYYIKNEAGNSVKRYRLVDRRVAMQCLELTNAEYKQFRQVVCDHLEVPSELCKDL